MREAWKGKVKHFRYYPWALSDKELTLLHKYWWFKYWLDIKKKLKDWRYDKNN